MKFSHESFITYTISRNYPFRWFTPVAIIGGLVFLVLFSVINIASSGFELGVQYSSNPNATVEQDIFSKWPIILSSNVRSSCQPANIPLNTALYTNNTALTYTVTEVRQNGAFLPSLIYYANPLENCSIEGITIDLSSYDRTAAQAAVAAYGVEGQANVLCTLPGGILVNLTASYNLVPPSATVWWGQTAFRRNATSKASLWWGESMLTVFWSELSLMMQSWNFAQDAANVGDQNGINAMTLYFRMNTTGTTDITQPDFFTLNWRINEGRTNQGRFYYYDTGLDIETTINEDIEPGLWTQADNFAKAFYSTVLTDLGQNSTTANILINSSALTNFTSNFRTAVADAGSVGPLVLGPSLVPYDEFNTTTGPLGVHSSVLATNYLCQVPQRRPWSELIVNLLVNDLVFLQALWLVYTIAVGWWLAENVPGSNVCEGCQIAPPQIPQTPQHYQAVSGGLLATTGDGFDGDEELSQVRNTYASLRMKS